MFKIVALNSLPGNAKNDPSWRLEAKNIPTVSKTMVNFRVDRSKEQNHLEHPLVDLITEGNSQIDLHNLTLITGHSGSGKSLLIECLHQDLKNQGIPNEHVATY